MGGSVNVGSPKWLVYFMENPIKMDDLGVPLFQETSIYMYHIALNRQLYAPKCESLSQPVQLCSLGVRENEAVQLG